MRRDNPARRKEAVVSGQAMNKSATRGREADEGRARQADAEALGRLHGRGVKAGKEVSAVYAFAGWADAKVSMKHVDTGELMRTEVTVESQARHQWNVGFGATKALARQAACRALLDDMLAEFRGANSSGGGAAGCTHGAV